MSTFETLPPEIRNNIYGDCLLVQHDLVAVNEQWGNNHNDPSPALLNSRIPYTKAAVALLAVNKRINEETLPVFYGQNVFKMSPNHLSNGQKSVYEKYATAFRRIVLALDVTDLSSNIVYKCLSGQHHEVLRSWATIIQRLAPMTILTLLKIQADGLIELPRPAFEKSIVALKEVLLQNIPQSVRNNATSRDRGLWITGLFARRNELLTIGQIWAELGPETDDGRKSRELDTQRKRICSDHESDSSEDEDYIDERSGEASDTSDSSDTSEDSFMDDESMEEEDLSNEENPLEEESL